jgi:NAD(P)-dependent dehydrogenase (short-subunit alcohol dehydrogenase family)
MNLTDRKALVTGASRGIGRTIAQTFAAAGARVAVHYHENRSAAESVLRSLSGSGHALVQGNIADAEEVRRFVDEAAAKLGGLDILVNNAAAHAKHALTQVNYEEWQKHWKTIVDVNLIGASNACYCAAKHMIARGGGKIINIGSRGAYRGEPDSPAYGASKAGMTALSQSLAKHLGPHHIYVTAVAPGYVETEMSSEFLRGPKGEEIRSQSPLNRVATTEEVANVVLFLAAPGSEWVTGGVIDVNGASYLR